MKMPSRYVHWTLAFACLLVLGAAPALAAGSTAPSEAPASAEVADPVASESETALSSVVGTPEALSLAGEPLGNCRVRCGFEFYWYGGMTESQCCNETQYCPDGSEGYAVAFQPYGGHSARCAP